MKFRQQYTKEQIDFIFNLRKQKFPVKRIIEEYGKKYDEKSYSSIEHLIRRYKSDYEKSEKVIEADSKYIIRSFVEQVKDLKYIPTQVEFSKKTGIGKRNIDIIFKSFDGLEKSAKLDSPKTFELIVDESSFTDKNFKKLAKTTKDIRKFFITTAVTGCTPHAKGMSAIETFCEANDAKLLVILVSDPANDKPKKYKFSAHPDLPPNGIVFRDLKLNNNLYISTIKLNAKQINPLTGLRVLASEGSCILGSPKQCLEPVPVFKHKEAPHHLITTGSITIPEYETKHYMSERTAYLANETHVLGGVIVEILNDEIFFYRHVQIDPDTGSFSDLDKRYSLDRGVESITAKLVQLGDFHVGDTDPVCEKVLEEIVATLRPDIMTVEDFCDNSVLNPYSRKSITQQSNRVLGAGFLNLQEELMACSEKIDDLCKWDIGKLVIKAGNHDNFLKRWLDSAGYATDELNHYEGVCLAKGMMEGIPPFEFAMREMYPFSSNKEVVFLKILDSYRIDGIENAVHGHIGSSGKRNPGLKGLSSYGLCNTGHTHAAGILGGVFRVGTSTKLQLGYNVGASAWSHTLLVQHRDKSRQLITIIGDKWRLKD